MGQDGRVQPMLALAGEHLPTGPDWVHEVKWDGVRLLAERRDGGVRLYARSGNEVTAAYPELAGLAAAYPDIQLDGEVVAFVDGRPSFSALAERMHVRNPRRAEQGARTNPVTFMAFDVLRLLGQDTTILPWSARRELLEKLDLSGTHVLVSPTYDDGPDLYRATREQGLEGIVSKRRSSLYLPGRRTGDWLKFPHRDAVSVVVGGWRPESTGGDRLGSVLVWIPGDEGSWEYAGRVGSGLAGRNGAAVRAALEAHPEDACPFAGGVPTEDAASVSWTTPRLVIDVRSLGRGTTGKLRQPSFVRVRPDLAPEDLLA